MSKLDDIRARLEAVPAPPWCEFCESGDWWIQQRDEDGSPIGESICNSNPDDMSSVVARFIEHAPADILYLLQDRDRWERRARELEALCADRL